MCANTAKNKANARPYLIRIAERLQSFTDRSQCWPWPGDVDRKGYGRLVRTTQPRLIIAAHRGAWELFHGPIPDGLFVCHRCDNPPCCNPAHLFLGTHADNTADMITKGRVCLGRNRWNTKLTDDQVREIRLAVGTHQAIAARFGVTRPTVSQIRRGVTRKHVL